MDGPTDAVDESVAPSGYTTNEPDDPYYRAASDTESDEPGAILFAWSEQAWITAEKPDFIALDNIE